MMCARELCRQGNKIQELRAEKLPRTFLNAPDRIRCILMVKNHSNWAVINTRGSLTFSLEYKTTPPSYPAHVLKSQQCDINTQFGTTFPNTTDIIWAYSGNQGHWRREIYYWEKAEGQAEHPGPGNQDSDFYNKRTGMARWWPSYRTGLGSYTCNIGSDS